MNIVNLNIHIDKPFGNLYRKECVLIAVFNHEGKLLLGEKPDFYPPAIMRLLGGGMEPNESSAQGAVRELVEEIGVVVAEDDLKRVATFNIDATDNAGNKYSNTTNLFFANIGEEECRAGDDVKHIAALDKAGLEELVKNYDSLPESLLYLGGEGEFSWYDYAQMYGVIHREVALNWNEGRKLFAPEA